MYIACYRGHDKVVQVLLDHSVQVDIQDKVSDISCIHVKLYDTTEVNKATLSHKKLTKMMSMCSAITTIMKYQYNILHKSYSLLRKVIVRSILIPTLNLLQSKNTLS